ncbi:hypothetical protein [Streptomyces sp. XH2]|uniref:hypothetical protein n=1 Tax=Streptomyces sp. XH2 TaxID=3412483 RepID=UPI003C7BCD2C
MREFRPLADELRPLAADAWATDPDDAGEGFTVEFLLVLPAPESDDVDEVLRTAAAPLLERLGFDAGSLDVDVEDRDAVVWADDGGRPDAVTVCGASGVCIRIGRDPDEPRGLAVDQSSVLTDDEALELMETMASLFGLVVVLHAEVAGLDAASARELVREQARRLRVRFPRPGVPESGIQVVDAPTGGEALRFSVAVVPGDEDPERPAAAVAVMTAAQDALGGRNWEPVATLVSRSGPCLTSGRRPAVPPRAGITGMRLFVAQGLVMSELAEEQPSGG